MPELNEAKLNHLQAPVNSRPQGKLSQDGNSSIRVWLCTLKSSCIRREADSQSPLFAQQLPSALLSRLELHITEAVVAAFGYMCGKCYSASDTEVMSHQAWPILCSCASPNVFPLTTIPSLVGSDSYLIEVGGPVLSLLSLSFICELSVCFALHCDTALANLPNESQELHNNGKTKKKWQQKSIYHDWLGLGLYY